MFTAWPNDELPGLPSPPLGGYQHVPPQLAAWPALAAAAADTGRRRADKERQKEDRNRRRREWDDRIRPLLAWAAGTDVLLAAMLLTWPSPARPRPPASRGLNDGKTEEGRLAHLH